MMIDKFTEKRQFWEIQTAVSCKWMGMDFIENRARRLRR